MNEDNPKCRSLAEGTLIKAWDALAESGWVPPRNSQEKLTGSQVLAISQTIVDAQYGFGKAKND